VNNELHYEKILKHGREEGVWGREEPASPLNLPLDKHSKHLKVDKKNFYHISEAKTVENSSFFQ